jgi:serine/threonine-protein kinase
MPDLPSPGGLVAARYRIEAEIGRGAMGVVFRARDASNQLFAIKVLLPEAVDTPGAAERFTNEAKGASGLTSEHTVRVYEAGTLDSSLPYMVMELLEGTDLESVLEKRGPLPVAEACDAVIDACDALAEAHAQGIIHRDLKPGNLFAARGPDGRTRVKVLDFGLSKVAAQQRQVALTSTGTLLGTPYYMAPEQLRSAKGADPRADIWSLGVILYEFVSKRVPFDGTSFGMLFGKIVSENPTSLDLVCANPVPAGFAEIVHRCLKKNKEERYPDVTALATALASYASPAGAAAAKKLAEGPAPRPQQARPAPSSKLGGTMLMATPSPFGGKGSVLPQTPAPAKTPRISVAPATNPGGQRPMTPVPFVPVSQHRPPTPAYPMSAAPQPPAAPDPQAPPAPSMRPVHPQRTLIVACAIAAILALGVILYAVRELALR